ncbi:MAG: DNA polymerase/3'-5' exonuclease PolX [Trueperaceae bacterium]|nr:DNA polymerase/3'-5' exonuclease PolX [Trueperaceae bacterium]MCW5819483.1 DNA polymerase/3'-5' exonuclease PolX [Trueperaceae bacterium]
MSNAEMVRLLEQYADLNEINGENSFKVRAYRNAAEAVASLGESVAAKVEAGEPLTDIKGVGKEIAEKLTVMATTGRFPQLEDLAKEVPPSLIELTRVKGVGPKLVQSLWRTLGITSVAELETAIPAGNLAGLPGVGAKKVEAILRGLEAYHRNVGRTRLGEVDFVIEPLLEGLRAVPDVLRLEVAGSYRRRRETVGDVDLLVATGTDEGSAAVTREFTAYPEAAEVLGSGETRSSVRLNSGIQVDLRVVPEDVFGAALLYFTGSKAHNVALRQAALDHDLHLSEYGLFEGGADSDRPATPGAAGKRVAGRTEEEIYARLGLDWVPPELREDRGELAAAAGHALPELITLADVRGDLHMHSTWSDGRATVVQMLEACAARGYEYMALTDHSKALAMTGGLDEAKLARQWEELDEVLGEALTRRSDAPAERAAPSAGVTLLRGMEVDILKDGSLDLSDEWLERLDIVLVSVHSHFELSQAEQTARVVKAVSHPQVNVLAHPTGRVLGERDPYAIDLAAVFEACLANGVAVEHNASYQRLDLSDANLMAAKARGVTVTLGSDAHSVDQLATMRYGVDQLRRAWFTSADVLNARPLAEVRRFLRKGRS